MFLNIEELKEMKNFAGKNIDIQVATQSEFIKYRINELITRIKTLTKLKLLTYDMPKLCKIIECLEQTETAVLEATECLTRKF